MKKDSHVKTIQSMDFGLGSEQDYVHTNDDGGVRYRVTVGEETFLASLALISSRDTGGTVVMASGSAPGIATEIATALRQLVRTASAKDEVAGTRLCLAISYAVNTALADAMDTDNTTDAGSGEAGDACSRNN